MKGMKKLLSILMVLTLVLSLGAIAFADGGATGTVTVETKPTNDQVVHTYELYQIFSGTQADEDKAPLGNVQWGTGIDSANFLSDLKEDGEIGSEFSSCETAADVAKALGESKVANIGEKFAAIAAKHLGTKTAEVTSATASSVKVNPGYYLIVDTTVVNGQQTAKNENMLQVTTNIEITNKYDVPSSEKYVKDSNDTTGETTEWQKSGDWDIGDKVPFKLEAKIPANTTNNYSEYALTFHDKEDAGLTFNADSVKVFVNGKELADTSAYTVTTSTSDGCTFEVSFANIKNLAGWKGIESDNEITVEYNATLNKNCVIGNDGNFNKMELEFSNDYNSNTKGRTPEKQVVVFTYDMDVNKIDDHEQPLEGAEFKLYKEVPEKTEGAFQLTKKGEKAEGEKAGDPKLHDDKYYVEYANNLKMDATDKTLFTAEGLDDGNYVIVETKTPAGYNTVDPIEFTLTAEHTANDGATKTNVTGPTDGFTIDMTRSDGAILDTNVQNFKGATLPETGGIGTTIFYIAGAVLVAGAVILLVTKKRVSGMEK